MQNERNVSLDLLKIFLAVLVVLIHSDFPTDLQKNILCYMTKNGVYRIAVPIFFIITGYYISFFSEEKTKIYMLKILKMYAVWTLVYSYFLVTDSFTPKVGEQNPISFLIGMRRVIKELIFGYGHLWYLIAIFFSLLFFGIIKKNSDKKNAITCVVLFLFGYILQCLGSFDLGELLFFKKWGAMLYRNFVFFSTPFLIVGFLIGRCNLIEKITFSSVISLIFLGGILLFIESIAFYKLANLNDCELLISLLLLCPSIFIFVSKINLKSSFSGFGGIATIMYLTHYFFIKLFIKIGMVNSGLIFITTLSMSMLAGVVVCFDYKNEKIQVMQLKFMKLIGL